MSGHIAKLSHQVFFWLKNPDSAEDLEQLLAGIRSLSAATEQRPVIDNSYSASELLFVDSIEDQNTYHNHPLHEQFIAEYSHLWSKVMVFDSISRATENEFGL